MLITASWLRPSDVICRLWDPPALTVAVAELFQQLVANFVLCTTCALGLLQLVWRKKNWKQSADGVEIEPNSHCALKSKEYAKELKGAAEFGDK